MRILRLSQLEQKPFTSNMIDNCFFVESINSHEMVSVPLKSVFDEIIKRAKESGLSVEMKDDKIVFLKNG